MSNLYEDHVTAFLALLTGAGLTAYDGQVDDDPAATYVLVYSYFETPDGLAAPDAVSLMAASVVLDPRMYVHCVGSTSASARAIAARVRAAVLDVAPSIAGRTCFPIRWREGQPVRRDEEIPGTPVFDQAEVYGWRSLPG